MFVKDLIFMLFVVITALPFIILQNINETQFIILLSSYIIVLIGVNIWSIFQSGKWLTKKIL